MFKVISPILQKLWSVVNSRNLPLPCWIPKKPTPNKVNNKDTRRTSLSSFNSIINTHLKITVQKVVENCPFVTAQKMKKSLMESFFFLCCVFSPRLTHFWLMTPFYIPWKQQILENFCFQRVQICETHQSHILHFSDSIHSEIWKITHD